MFYFKFLKTTPNDLYNLLKGQFLTTHGSAFFKW